MKRRNGLILCISFVMISLLTLAVVLNNRAYNKDEHVIEFSNNILSKDGISDKNVSVRIVPRGFDNDENSAWYHSFFKPGENINGTPHHAVGTIYELTLTNLTENDILNWTAHVVFPKAAMFNNGWNGTFTLHQYVDENEKEYDFFNNMATIEGDVLEFYNDQAVLLVPMHLGDYFDYTPSQTSYEVPVSKSNIKKEQLTSRTIGFIAYVEDVFIEDVICFNQGYIKYKVHRAITSAPLFYVCVVFYWIWLVAAFVTVIVGIKFKQMQKEKQLMETMVHEFETDELTNIYTRQAFFHYGGMLLENNDKEYGIAIVTIDNFNITLSKYGESICNEFLIYLAEYLKKQVPNGYVGRFSRSKFAIVGELDESFLADPNIFIDSDMLSKSPMPNQVLKLGVYSPVEKSVGIRRCCDRVMLALANIKGQYGQNVSYYYDKLETQLLDDHQIEEYMEEALTDNQFVVYYQPKHDTVSRKIIGAEALVRWIHPKYGFMSPGQFIPIFERTGFITKLDAFVFERVCQDIKDWCDRGLLVTPISINFSRKDFYEENWLEQRFDYMEEVGVDTSYIHLEVTESLYAEDTEVIIEKVKQIQQKGIKVEMDDFGSGYSSLGLLTDMSLDVLKLDISFVKNIKATEVVVESIINLAHSLNLSIVAEGVETEEQYQIIKEKGCDSIQGYYFAKPMPKEEFEEYMQ